MSRRVAVVYLGDANYHNYALFSMASLALHHSQPLDFYLMQSGYDAPLPASLVRLLTERGHRGAVAPFGLVPAMQAHMDRALDHRITPVACGKISAISRYAADYDHVLYIDGDILAFADLDLHGRANFAEPLAACPDLSMSTGVDIPDFLTNCAAHGASPRYFNSGLLFANAAAWNKMDMEARFIDAIRRHSEVCPYRAGTCDDIDQCPSNMVLNGGWRALPMALNLQKSAYQTDLWASAVCRHYTGKSKFLPVQPHRCDAREYKLLTRINALLGGIANIPPYDFGVAYAANALRRTGERRRVRAAIAAMEARVYPPASTH